MVALFISLVLFFFSHASSPFVSSLFFSPFYIFLTLTPFLSTRFARLVRVRASPLCFFFSPVPMFCSCGTLVNYPTLTTEPVLCRRCSAPIHGLGAVLTTTKKFMTVETRASHEVKGASIKMNCPSCGNDRMLYNTAQLRSADEGQTVFYTCEKCGYKETVQS